MTLVIDASAIAEYLVASELGGEAAEHMARHSSALHTPHLAIVETTSAFRGWVRRGELSEVDAFRALDDLADLPALRWASEPFLPRVWHLRDVVTVYDATYVALAEALGADLLTADRRLARTVEDRTACRAMALGAG